MPLATYQLLICPYRFALRNAHALVSLNRRHNPCAPFVVTMSGREFSCVQHVIDHGVLGVLDRAHTIEDSLRTLGPLLSLYQLRFSIAHRERWVADCRDWLRKNPVHHESEFLNQSIQENRIMCLQALVAIEGSMQALQAYAGDLAHEATERMGWLPGKAGKIVGPRKLTPVPRYADT